MCRPHHVATLSWSVSSHYWDSVLAWLAKRPRPRKANELHKSIRSASEDIEAYLRAKGLTAKDLTAQSRSIRGWLAYFSERENFDAYVAAALGHARSSRRQSAAQGAFVAPAIVEFRPTPGLYGSAATATEPA